MRAGNVHQPFELTNILYRRMVIRLSEGVSYLPGAGELINELRSARLPMALVSASTREIMDAALRSIAPHPFQTTISADDVSQTKPHPEGYLIAAERIGVSIERSLIIEDSVTGMNAAIASGAYVLGIPHAVDLPSGPKVIHQPSLININRDSLTALFSEIIF
jgi:HAD superfamily hydrolase (TIGR01509 family)